MPQGDAHERKSAKFLNKANTLLRLATEYPPGGGGVGQGVSGAGELDLTAPVLPLGLDAGVPAQPCTYSVPLPTGRGICGAPLEPRPFPLDHAPDMQESRIPCLNGPRLILSRMDHVRQQVARDFGSLHSWPGVSTRVCT